MSIRDSAVVEFAVCCVIGVAAFSMACYVFFHGFYRATEDTLADPLFVIMFILNAVGAWRTLLLMGKKPRWVAVCGLLFLPIWAFIFMLALTCGGR